MLRYWTNFNGAAIEQFSLRYCWNFPREGDSAKVRAIAPIANGAPMALARAFVTMPAMRRAALRLGGRRLQGAPLAEINQQAGRGRNMDDREAVLRARQELREADRAALEAEAIAYQKRMAAEAARRRMENLRSQLGPRRVHEILAGGR
jgi:hypothetical protein